MLNRIFTSPDFEDEGLKFKSRFLNAFCWTAILILLLLLMISVLTNYEYYTTVSLLGLILSFALALLVLRTKLIALSGMLPALLGWAWLTFHANYAGGIRDPFLLGYVALALLAGFVINYRAAIALLFLSTLSFWTLAYLESNGSINPFLESPQSHARSLTIVYAIFAILFPFVITSLQSYFQKYVEAERKILRIQDEFQSVQRTMEQAITERTAELTALNIQNQHKAQQYETISEVTRALNPTEGLEPLLKQAAQLISSKFNFYHVGLFLLDESRDYVLLSASNSEGGQRMLAKEHKLQVGKTGIVGYVAGTGAARLAFDTGADAVFFENPDLPQTRSELALPLRSSGQLIGVLDIQSTESSAFTMVDAEVLAVLADQVAIAIQSARAYHETQRLLREAQSAIGSYVSEAWRIMQPESQPLGYQTVGSLIKPLATPLEDPNASRALSTGEMIVSDTGTKSSVYIPITLRGQPIGVININSETGQKWTQDQLEVARAVAERISLAIETATLIRATQHRAQVERITSEITGKISSSTRVESILQIAAQELSRALGGSDVLVQVEPLDVDLASATE